jgi:hypothetical protein
MVNVPMGQHDPVDAWHSTQDLGARSRRAGIDQRHGIVVAPYVDLPSLDAQHGPGSV